MKTRLEKIDKILCELKKDELVSEIYSLKDNLTEKDDDVLLRKDFKSLVSDIPSKEETLKILKDPDDVDIIFKKAGIIAFLYGLTSLDGINDFASNLNKSTLTNGVLKLEELTLETVTQEEAEKKGIQYSVAAFSGFQQEVDKIMKKEIFITVNESSNPKENDPHYFVNDLDEIDYEFIKLDKGDKKRAIDLVEDQAYTDSENLNDDNMKKFFEKIPTSENLLSRIPIWNSLYFEDEAINRFIDCIKPSENNNSGTKENGKETSKKKEFGEAYRAFKKSVVKKYIGRKTYSLKKNSECSINSFFIRFSKVWKDKTYTQDIYDARMPRHSKGIKHDSSRYIRGAKGGFHEDLKFSMYIDYLANKKWGLDGSILTILLKELVRKTEDVKIFVIDKGIIHEYSHLELCGGSSKGENWDKACRKMHEFHTKLDDAIYSSNTVGDVLFKVRKVVYSTDMTENSKKDFESVFTKMLLKAEEKKDEIHS